jgi:hypothetical protein
METDNKKLAKTIDFINKWAINYYTRDLNEKPDPNKLEEELLMRKGINYKYFDHARRIMKHEGLIDYVLYSNNDNIIKELKHTEKGLMLYLNGGMAKLLKRERNKAYLVVIGQIAAFLGGLHYLFENYQHFSELLFGCN